MRPRDRIDPFHIAALGVTLVVASAIFFVPAPLAQTAGRDAWLAVATAGPLVAAATYGLVRLYFRPRVTPIHRAAALPGLRPVAGLFFAAYGSYVAIVVLRETAPLLASVHQDTGIEVYLAGLTAVGWILAAYGRETLARCGVILFTLIVIAAVTNVVLAIPGNANFRELLPLLERGPVPVAASLPLLLAWHGELLVLTFFADGLHDAAGDRAGRVTLAMLGSTLASLGLIAGVTLASLVVLGPAETARSVVPTMVLARMVEVAPFLPRVEILILTAWLLAIFVKLGILIYVAGLALQKGFGLPEGWRIPLTALAAAASGFIALYAFPNVTALLEHIRSVWPLTGTASLVLTLLLGFVPPPRQTGE